MYDMTAQQEEVVSKIEKMGFRFTKIGRFGDAYLHRKRGSTTLLAEVDENGLVQGMSFEEWKKEIERVFDKNNKHIS